jgi:hypothetical protein
MEEEKVVVLLLMRRVKGRRLDQQHFSFFVCKGTMTQRSSRVQRRHQTNCQSSCIAARRVSLTHFLMALDHGGLILNEIYTQPTYLLLISV